MSPKVSIIIPVFNGADFLAEAISSAINQTYQNIEIIVVNDGSSDDGATERVARTFGSRIQYIFQENGGVAAALNTGIQAMQGELFSWLSHDDKYLPTKIHQQVEAFTLGGGVDIVYSDFWVIDQAGRRLRSHVLPSVREKQMRCFLTSSSALHGCTLLIPKKYLEEEGGFDLKLRTTQDYDMWFKLASKWRFRRVEQCLVEVRYHASQLTSSIPDTVRNEQDLMYARFVDSLVDREVEPFSNGRVELFYLRLLSRFIALRQSLAQNAVEKRIAHLKINSPRSIFFKCQVLWARTINMFYLRCKVSLRRKVFRSPNGVLAKMINVLGQVRESVSR